jgi:hypothetical protein
LQDGQIKWEIASKQIFKTTNDINFHTTCTLVSQSFLRLWSKHITDHPEVTTTKTCFNGCPSLYLLSITPVAIATARLPVATRVLSGNSDSSVNNLVSLNPSSTRLECGSNTYTHTYKHKLTINNIKKCHQKNTTRSFWKKEQN